MNKFIKLLSIVFALILSVACSSITDDLDDFVSSETLTRSSKQAIILDKDSAIMKFAEILSKATYDRQDVREFLKKEAEKEFDMNNDVLYKAVKNDLISGKSFSTILANYSSVDTIIAIEESVPLLNILIPKISIFGIDASNLDVADNEIPIAVSVKAGMKLFLNGNMETIIPNGELPNFHTIVVNENNRVEINENTRSNENVYSFISPYYDKKYVESRKTRTIVDDPNYVGGRAMQSFSYFNGTNYSTGLQRDYIYYGLTPNENKGTFHHEISEYLLFMSVDPKSYFVFKDDIGDESYNDPIIKNETVVNRKESLTEEELIKKMWSQGAYNFRIEVYSANKTIPWIIRLPYYPQELWNFNIDVKFEHKTWFKDRKYTYTIDPVKFTAKTVKVDAMLGKWDLSREGLERYIMIFEEDKKAEKTETIELEMTQVNSIKVNNDIKIGLGTGVSGSVGTDYNSSTTTRKKHTFTRTRSEEDDHLATITVYFYDPIIIGRSGHHYVDVHTYKLGLMELAITAKEQ